MEIKTGASESVSVIGEEIFHAIQRGEEPPELKQSLTTLWTYTGSQIPIRESVSVLVEHNGQSVRLLLIVTGDRAFTIGRDWLLERSSQRSRNFPYVKLSRITTTSSRKSG